MKIRKSSFIVQGIFYITFFATIVFICALMDLGLRWDNLNKDNLDVFGYITLIAFRLTVYVIPAIITWVLSRKLSKNRTTLSTCYSIQFFWYSILLSIYNLVSLDYIWKVEIFSKLDSFVFLLGFIVSILIHKKLPSEAMNKFNTD